MKGRLELQTTARRGVMVAALACSAAAAAPPGPGTADAVRQRISAAVLRATGLAPSSVEPSSLVPGFYEVRAKDAVAYVDAQAKVLVKGPVIDLATGENLSQGGGPGGVKRVDVSALPVADAIVSVAGKGQRKLYVFVDPNCSFCRALEPELAKLSNATVYRFVMPALGPGSQAAARRIWCAPDRAAAWRSTISGSPETAPAPTGCDGAALERNLALAKRLNVAATPTLVFGSGDRVAAVMRADEIEARLSVQTATAVMR